MTVSICSPEPVPFTGAEDRTAAAPADRRHRGRAYPARIEPSREQPTEDDDAALARSRGSALIEALERKLAGAQARSEIAATLAGALAAEFAAEEDRGLIAEAARLQEIGKLYVPGELLTASPAGLTPSQRRQLASHFEHGRAVARGAGIHPRACAWILHAQERWDGAGPDGLSGEEIPVASRIVAATREYLDAPAFAEAGEDPRTAALRRLGELSGSVLDPEIAAAAARLAAEPGTG